MLKDLDCCGWVFGDGWNVEVNIQEKRRDLNLGGNASGEAMILGASSVKSFGPIVTYLPRMGRIRPRAHPVF